MPRLSVVLRKLQVAEHRYLRFCMYVCRQFCRTRAATLSQGAHEYAVHAVAGNPRQPPHGSDCQCTVGTEVSCKGKTTCRDLNAEQLPIQVVMCICPAIPKSCAVQQLAVADTERSVRLAEANQVLLAGNTQLGKRPRWLHC